MHRIVVGLTALLLVMGSIHASSAQSDAKPTRTKLTVEHLKEMKARWSANKTRLKACRQEVRAKGLSGDDRWFYIEDCMSKQS